MFGVLLFGFKKIGKQSFFNGVNIFIWAACILTYKIRYLLLQMFVNFPQK